MIEVAIVAALVNLERAFVNLFPAGTPPAGFDVTGVLHWYAWLNGFLPLDEIFLPVAGDGIAGVIPAMLGVLAITIPIYTIFTAAGFVVLRKPG